MVPTNFTVSGLVKLNEGQSFISKSSASIDPDLTLQNKDQNHPPENLIVGEDSFTSLPPIALVLGGGDTQLQVLKGRGKAVIMVASVLGAIIDGVGVAVDRAKNTAGQVKGMVKKLTGKEAPPNGPTTEKTQSKRSGISYPKNLWPLVLPALWIGLKYGSRVFGAPGLAFGVGLSFFLNTGEAEAGLPSEKKTLQLNHFLKGTPSYRHYQNRR